MREGIDGATTDPLRIANPLGPPAPGERNEVLLATTYFITKDMKIDLQQQNLNGVLPILYVFLARADKSIRNVTFGSLSSNGAFQESAPGKKGGSIPGVRINYTDTQSRDSQTLYYFTTDISDGGIKSNPGLKFCERFGTGSSFLKSSSYLMSRATIRNFILDTATELCRTILEFHWDISIQVSGTCAFLAIIRTNRSLQTTLPAETAELLVRGPPPLGFGFGYR